MTPDRAAAVLGLRAPWTPGDVADAFKTLAKHTHPDTPDGDAEEFKEVNAAWQLLRGTSRAAPVAPRMPHGTTVSIIFTSGGVVDFRSAFVDPPGSGIHFGVRSEDPDVVRTG